MTITVIGAGKMGLPLACQFASRGGVVIAADCSRPVVDAINSGISPIDEPGAADLLASAVKSGALRATTDTAAAAAESEAIVVIVPALLTEGHDADLSALESVSRQVASTLKPGTMVSYETTVPVGSTRARLLPILETGGLKAGKDFDLVYSPERVKSRYVFRNLTGTPKIVGGVNPDAAKRGEEFYARFLGASIINVGTLEAAEMAKLAGMVYRDVNIALANELARYAEVVGLDLRTVIAAANTDGEANILTPGIGVGGHCTPVYPYFLIREGERLGVPMTLADRSRRINDGQAEYTVRRAVRAAGSLSGRSVLILGLAFRPSVKEHLMSPAFLIQPELQKAGAEVFLHDPLFSDDEIRRHGFVPRALQDVPAADVIILNTAHLEYARLNFDQLVRDGLKLVVDGRDFWNAGEIRRAGAGYIGIGLPDEFQRPETPDLPIARPVLGGNEAEAAADVVRSGWVMQGPQVSELEREFAAYTEAPFACAVSSGTAALHLALLAAGVKPGDEVITVSHSYIATANSIRYCGAVPVFVDIEPATFNINPALIERAISRRTRAILCVHQMGMPCDLSAIMNIASRRGLIVIEDAACAAGSEIVWKNSFEKIGKPHGDIACFSFHPRKLLTTGDGGMVTTSNEAWDRRIRGLRQHGLAAPSFVRNAPKTVVAESFAEVGYNYRLTDIQAAVGREQLRRLPELIRKRRSMAERYSRMLQTIEGVSAPIEPAWARSNWQSYCVRLDDSFDQRRVMEKMRTSGVATRTGIMCAHREPAYSHEPWSCGEGVNEGKTDCRRGCCHLEQSERAQDHCIILPLFHQMTERDQLWVVESLQSAIKS